MPPVVSRAAVGACAPREVPLRPGAVPPGRGRHVEDGPSPRAASQCASNRIKPIPHMRDAMHQSKNQRMAMRARLDRDMTHGTCGKVAGCSRARTWTTDIVSLSSGEGTTVRRPDADSAELIRRLNYGIARVFVQSKQPRLQIHTTLYCRKNERPILYLTRLITLQYTPHEQTAVSGRCVGVMCGSDVWDQCVWGRCVGGRCAGAMCVWTRCVR